VGQRLPFAAEPVDISPVTYRWRFGDRRTATGANVTHAYRRSGRFVVTLIATDAAGHSVVATRTSVRISKR
jgi:PKD repeat protein